MNNKTILTTLALLTLVLLSINLASADYVGYNTHGEDYYYKEKISKTVYDERDDYVLTRSIEVYYDNDDRHSTRDYRHGYSYRTSTPYWEDHHDYHDVKDVRVIRLRDSDRYYDKDRYYSDRNAYYNEKRDPYDYPYYRYSTTGGDYRYNNKNDYYWKDQYYNNLDYYGYGSWQYNQPRTQTRYITYTKSYETRECYDYPPKGKLFYVKC